eukprot:6205769-Pleurochrysis_carterae.AAC.5
MSGCSPFRSSASHTLAPVAVRSGPIASRHLRSSATAEAIVTRFPDAPRAESKYGRRCVAAMLNQFTGSIKCSNKFCFT